VELNHVFIGNPQSTKLIIFLHEGLGSIAQWKEYPSLVCKALNCYGLIYDRSGYGLSPGNLLNRNINYLHEGSNELEIFIDSLKLSAYDLYLYGHSDGGSIALIYASSHSKQIKGIITEAAHVFVEEETLLGVRKALTPFKDGKFSGLQKYHGQRYEEVFMAWNQIWLNPQFKTWDITYLLKQIECPQLIIQGLDDQYGTLKQVSTIKNETTGHSVVFNPENCGHVPHKESQKNTLEEVIKFIDAI